MAVSPLTRDDCEMAEKKSEDHQAFGKRVRELRAGKFSQEGFADACQIDRSYMGAVERGERNLSLANILKIIDTLAVQPSEFFRSLDRPRKR